jgi:hypothetical protein
VCVAGWPDAQHHALAPAHSSLQPCCSHFLCAWGKVHRVPSMQNAGIHDSRACVEVIYSPKKGNMNMPSAVHESCSHVLPLDNGVQMPSPMHPWSLMVLSCGVDVFSPCGTTFKHPTWGTVGRSREAPFVLCR